MGSVVDEPGHSPSQVVNVIRGPRELSSSVRDTLHNLGQAAVDESGPVGLGVADEPDEALIDRGHPSHASHGACHVFQTPDMWLARRRRCELG